MTKISQLQEIINNSDNIVFFGGAGVSTESGIPDFRSESGIFNSLKKYGASPILTIQKNSLIIIRKILFLRMQSQILLI